MQSSVQRLLVVEDDVAVARALSRTLARAGSAVAIARSCLAARASAQSFDMAVLDLDLPDGNGVDLARDLIASGRVASVLFFTGSIDAGLLARARLLGPVLLKADGTSGILTLLAQERQSVNAEAPQSRTEPSSPKARGFRAHSRTQPIAAARAIPSASLRRRAR